MRLKYFILFIIFFLACSHVPTQPTFEATVHDAYNAYLYAFEASDWFSEEKNGIVIVWFEAYPLNIVQLDKRNFQILCNRCCLWGDLENWKGEYDCILRPIVFRWFRDDPIDPKNWTWRKVE